MHITSQRNIHYTCLLMSSMYAGWPSRGYLDRTPCCTTHMIKHMDDGYVRVRLPHHLLPN